MMKYVYKNEKGLVILNQEVEILELASIDDLRNEVKEINAKIEEKRKYSPSYALTAIDKLNIDPLNDEFMLQEDIYYWDRDEKEFLFLETYQDFYDHNTWTEKEKDEYLAVILSWISCNDHTYDLYSFLRDMNNEDSPLPRPSDYSLRMERLFHIELENEGLLESYKSHYKKDREEYKFYLKSKGLENADVSGGVQ
ncbi:hypothetical protein [Metabacillus litoralis]|uniref:hypothetical protein n=1 Tax=Metabacillus litoralis TaxID=152268 RepID=UPI002040686A|nr:hypothetical protein [Metabacillus litoralis]MCM3161017.1 hypothetical protein [Metabacillus litoralis]